MKKGITFIALLATIAISLILISTVVISYNNINDDAQKKEFAKEIYLVKNSLEQYNLMNNVYPLKNTIDVNINNFSKGKNQFLDEPNYSLGIVTLYEIDLAMTNIKELKYGNRKISENDRYLFSKATEKVYYLEGVEILENKYYTLTDELYKLIGINEIK